MELFCLAKCIIFYIVFSLRRRNQTICHGKKKMSEEIAKYDDTIEVKEEQGNALLYLMKRLEIAVIALSRTIFTTPSFILLLTSTTYGYFTVFHYLIIRTEFRYFIKSN
jgi:hypothetical protein